MKNQSRFIRFIILSLFITAVIFAPDAHSAEVRSVRIGQHLDYTRVVFELDRKTNYQVEWQLGEQGSELLVHLDAQAAKKLLRSKSKLVRAVQVKPHGRTAIAHVRLNTEHLRLGETVMSNPPRIVLDLRAVEEAAPEVIAAPAPATAASVPLEENGKPSDEAKSEASKGKDATVVASQDEFWGDVPSGSPQAEVNEKEVTETDEVQVPPVSSSNEAPSSEASGRRWSLVALLALAALLWFGVRRRMQQSSVELDESLGDSAPSQEEALHAPAAAADTTAETSSAELENTAPGVVSDLPDNAVTESQANQISAAAEPSSVAVPPRFNEAPEEAEELIDDSEVQQVASLENRIALLEKQLSRSVEARERLERQIAAHTEELRVQRSAIARTQRVVRGMARPAPLGATPGNDGRPN